jgi:hypothetical protein
MSIDDLGKVLIWNIITDLIKREYKSVVNGIKIIPLVNHPTFQ